MSVLNADFLTSTIDRAVEAGIPVVTGIRTRRTRSGWPVFTRNALAAVDPPKTKVVSFDTIPPAPELLKAGKVQVPLGQKDFGWGSESGRRLSEIVAGRRPARPVIDSGVDVVTAENVEAYLADWARLERGGQQRVSAPGR